MYFWLYILLHDFNLTYYSGIILGSFSILLFIKLCWHIGLTPNDGIYMASFVVAEQVGEVKLSVAINEEQIKGSPFSIVVGRNYQAIDKPSKIVNNDGSMGGSWGVAFGRKGLWAQLKNP